MNRSYSKLFFFAYFIYYSGYCIFSSYMVPYLVEKGYSAGIAGVVTSLTLLANILMQPVAGYINDTLLSTRRYLAVSIFIICGFAIINSLDNISSILNISVIISSAAFSYSFSQLMDAWVDRSREVDGTISYSKIRAGGSIGFGLTSIAFGYIVSHFGYRWFFLIQAGIFICLLPLIYFLPDLNLNNKSSKIEKESSLSFFQTFGILIKDKRYCFLLLIFTLYWMGHRPVGSYLSLIVRQRGGVDSIYGNICGIGAMMEFFMLLFMHRLKFLKTGENLIFFALGTSVLRPALLVLFGNINVLYFGQIMQSISFALYFSASVDAFSKISDYRIKSFSISVGLTIASVVGTIMANMVGGVLFDIRGAQAVVLMSLMVSLINLLFYKSVNF
jgi:PPP family 3-phenylpropionic acid transporter